MIEGLIDALAATMAWPGPIYMFGGILFGLLFGILPGVGPSAAMALLIPLSYGLGPELALAFLMAANVSSGIGGQITSILVNIPGDAGNAATTFDGYPMTRQGRAAEALGAATTASVAGAIIGTILLIAFIPISRTVILSFSYPEFFMTCLAGLALIAVLTQGQTFKGLISAGIGLLIAFIGLDPIAGNTRFVFDQLYLWDGIDVVPALVGLFAGAEMLSLYAERQPVSMIKEEGSKPSRFFDGVVATVRAWKTTFVSSILGFIIGVIPGVGGTVASFLAYGQAARSSKEPETFGRGNVRGVIASESANDSDRSGALLPTIAFGIPGGASMAVLLGALILHGVPAGPNLMRNHEAIVYVLVVASIVPRLIAAGIVTVLGARAAWFTKIRGELLAPVITAVALVGVYAVRAQILDVLVAIIFGYLGFAMKRYGFSRVALVIALVLGVQIEASFHQTLTVFGPAGFFTRPISLVLFVIVVLTLVIPMINAYRRRGTGAANFRMDT